MFNPVPIGHWLQAVEGEKGHKFLGPSGFGKKNSHWNSAGVHREGKEIPGDTSRSGIAPATNATRSDRL